MAKERAVLIPCSDERLIGILHIGNPAARTGVVIVVGGPQYRVGSHRQFVLTARKFAAAGIPVLRFDYRGMGDSTSSSRPFDAVDNDIRAAVDCLQAELPGVESIMLMGLCDAASACLLYVGQDSRLSGLILLNPWVRTGQGEAQAYLRYYYLRRILQGSFWRKVFAGDFHPGRSLRELLGTVRRAQSTGAPVAARGTFVSRMIQGLNSFARPVLILVSGRDLIAREFSDLCTTDTEWRVAVDRPTVTTVMLPDADHTMSCGKDFERSVEACLTWLAATASSNRIKAKGVGPC